MAGLVNSW